MAEPQTTLTNSSRRSAVLISALCIGLSLVVVACGGSQPSTSNGNSASITPPSAIKAAGEINYCSEGDYPPVTTLKGGSWEGSDIDMGTDIARRMGVKAAFTLVSFDGLIPALDAKKCDAVLSGLSATPARATQVDFAIYVNAPQAVMVVKGNPKGIHSPEDLSGKAVSVLAGTNTLQALQAVDAKVKGEGKPGLTITVFQRDADAAQALAVGKSDAYAAGYVSISFYVNAPDSHFDVGFVDFPGIIPPNTYGIATRKGDTDLHSALIQALREMYSDGTMAKILDKWHIPSFALSTTQQTQLLH